MAYYHYLSKILINTALIVIISEIAKRNILFWGGNTGVNLVDIGTSYIMLVCRY